MIKHFALGTALAALATAPAFAGGYTAPVIEEAPAVITTVAAVPTWAGGYVGANLNYGKGKLKADGDFGDVLEEVGIGRTLLKPDGASGALRAGYDWQSGAMVYGLGAEYNFGKYKDNRNLVPEGSDATGPDLQGEVKNMATIFARAGYAFNDQFMAYGLLGYSRAKGELTLSAEEDVLAAGSRTVSGATYGLGAEYRINQSWSSYAEYTHTDFGKVKDTEIPLKLELDQFKLGVNYRF